MSNESQPGKNIKGRGLFTLDVTFIFIINSFILVGFDYLYKNNIMLNDFSISLILSTVVVTIMNLAVGLYDPKLRDSIRALFRRAVVSIALTYFTLEVLIFSVLLPSDSSNTSLPWLMLSALGITFTVRYLTISSSTLGYSKKRVIVIGAGERASIIQKRMRRMVDRKNFELLGFISVPDDKPVNLGNETILNINYPESLVEYVSRHGVDEIVIAPDERRGCLPVSELFECKVKGVEVLDILDFMEEETGQIAVNLIYPSWLIYSDGFNSNNHLKEKFDYLLNFTLAFIIMLFTWPLMFITILAIYLEDGYKNKASVFYKQVRVGLDGKPFEIFKFRSMRPDAEKNGAQFATKQDSRVTRVGNFIRKYRIDELPQLFNVFKGEMGFVGPRPERPEFVDKLIKESEYYTYRHNVRPGLTGWAQLKYPYGASTEDSIEKLKFDLYYIKHRSILLDLLILVRTVEIILFGKGR